MNASFMSLDPGLVELLTRRLSRLEDDTPTGGGLVADAQRLCKRLARFIQLGLAGPPVDEMSLGLACYALQLPARSGSGRPSGARSGLRQRCGQAAELIVSFLDEMKDATKADSALGDRTCRVLQQTPQRSPALVEARLLADAVNLDDFGVIGLVCQAMQIGAAGESAEALSAAMEKREQYGYWDMRLKDGFHFKPVEEIARRRLKQARQVTAMLNGELGEDQVRTP